MKRNNNDIHYTYLPPTMACYYRFKYENISEFLIALSPLKDGSFLKGNHLSFLMEVNV